MNIKLSEKEEELLEQIHHEMSKPYKSEFKLKWVAKQLGRDARGLSPIMAQLEEKGLIQSVTNTRNSNTWTADVEEIKKYVNF